MKLMNLETNTGPALNIEPATLTSYPEPCPVCSQHQCGYNPRHEMIFALKNEFEKQLEIYCKKPPEDGSGLLVATSK